MPTTTFTQYIEEHGGKPRMTVAGWTTIDHTRMKRLWDDWRNS